MKLPMLYTSNMCSLLCVSYTSIKLLKNTGAVLEDQAWTSSFTPYCLSAVSPTLTVCPLSSSSFLLFMSPAQASKLRLSVQGPFNASTCRHLKFLQGRTCEPAPNAVPPLPPSHGMALLSKFQTGIVLETSASTSSPVPPRWLYCLSVPCSHKPSLVPPPMDMQLIAHQSSTVQTLHWPPPCFSVCTERRVSSWEK